MIQNIRVLGCDERVVNVARVSYARDYGNFDLDRDVKLIKYLLQNRHGSPFEHVVLAIEGSEDYYLWLLKSIDYFPTNQIYYVDGWVLMNLRTYINIRHMISYHIDEHLLEYIPGIMSILNDRPVEQYTRDSGYLGRLDHDTVGSVVLVDKLELSTTMDYYTFMIECPLFVARQWFRHRFGSYNEVSRRYTSHDLKFYRPSSWRLQSKRNKQASENIVVDDAEIADKYNSLVSESYSLYNHMINIGVAREQARMILPQSMMTRFYWTVSRIALDNFLSLRMKDDAQYEIRELAILIYRMVGYGGADSCLIL